MEAKQQLPFAPPNQAKQPFLLCSTEKKKAQNGIKSDSLPEAQTDFLQKTQSWGQAAYINVTNCFHHI